MNESIEQIEIKLKQLIEEIRPYLQKDGGDVEFAGYDSAVQVVYVKMTGSCTDCPFAIYTLRAGIERYIIKSLPFIHRIERVY